MELMEKLDCVINDVRHQKTCIRRRKWDDMWETSDYDNWNSVDEILSEVRARFALLEDQNNLMWIEKPHWEDQNEEEEDSTGN